MSAHLLLDGLEVSFDGEVADEQLLRGFLVGIAAAQTLDRIDLAVRGIETLLDEPHVDNGILPGHAPARPQLTAQAPGAAMRMCFLNHAT